MQSSRRVGRASALRSPLEGEVEVTLVDQAPGHPERELSWANVAAKFSDCATQAGLHPGKAQAAFSLLARLETCADLREVVALLHGRPVTEGHTCVVQ
jgi:hypothetical protein